MRRMNYPRFDKPTYTGIFNFEQLQFVMNNTLEPGIYFVLVNDTEAGAQYSCTFTVKMDTTTSCSWYSARATEQIYLEYSPDYGNIIQIASSGGISNPVNPEATIELYKLN